MTGGEMETMRPMTKDEATAYAKFKATQFTQRECAACATKD
jgi:hypothetical protein